MTSYIEPIIYKNILTHEECDYLMEYSKDKLNPSIIGNQKITDQQVRQSYSCGIYNREDSVILAIVERISIILGFHPSKSENIQITRYDKGGFYLTHLDVDVTENGPIARNEGRCLTCIIGLNENYEGGKTYFPRLNGGTGYRIPKGGILVFRNTDVNNFVDLLSKHEGQIVTSGEKWISTLWFYGPCFLKHSVDEYLAN